jgi:hypothetical protein
MKKLAPKNTDESQKGKQLSIHPWQILERYYLVWKIERKAANLTDHPYH